MTIPFPRILLTVFLCAVFPRPASAQRIVPMLGTPFTATVISYEEGQVRPGTKKIARASDGSIYEGDCDRDGRLLRADIDDVPNDRHIMLFPQASSHTYTLRTPSHGKSRLWSVDQVRESWCRFQRLDNEQPDHGTPDRQEHHTPLGEKLSDGMILFGFRSEVTYSDGTKKIDERWESDLGITMSNTYVLRVGTERAYVVTNLKREEPDPSLFQIPKEYLSNPLLDASKPGSASH
jgi:hypothetical protein